jgi:glycerophosphoryl diester phosphodiesterase
MQIISHRGCWIKPEEKNTQTAFQRSFKLGFGTETDIRDLNSNLIISHDPPRFDMVFETDEFLNVYSNSNLPLALNVKSDGLHELVEKFIKKGKLKNYFLFDMSIPDTIGYLNKNLNVFIRQSEYELDLPFYEQANGIWLDAFVDLWYNEKILENHINNGKKVAIVSVDLHNRKYLKQWGMLKQWDIINNNNIILCTDYPEKAIKYFKK